jgi:hypothetical protein
LGLFGIASLAIAIYTFFQPLTRLPDPISYTHTGTYYYTAAAPPGIYDADKVSSGEPIFPEKTCTIELGFVYNLTGTGIENITGNQQMYARVSDDQSGWKRIIPFVSQVSFTGNTFTNLVSLDLCQVEQLVAAVEQQTRFLPSFYRLDITSDVSITGTINGQPFQDIFSPTLTFYFDKLHFFIPANTDSSVNPMSTTKQGSFQAAGSVANRVSLFGWDVTISSIRAIALIVFGLSLVAMITVFVSVYEVARRSENSMIRLKYSNMIVDVFESNIDTISLAVEVANIDDLAKLAERNGATILHTTRNGAHLYIVQANGTSYRYTAKA